MRINSIEPFFLYIYRTKEGGIKPVWTYDTAGI